MKQGSAFLYKTYAVARRARIGFSLMTHCLCHERGTRFSAVPDSTPNSCNQDRFNGLIILSHKITTYMDKKLIYLIQYRASAGEAGAGCDISAI
jgi:hypothetical protein